MSKQKAKQHGWRRYFAWLLVAGGGLGLLASLTLSIEKVQLLQDPDFIPSCNLNPILSCGSVMMSDQASAFGFPNPYIGIASFAVLITVGMAMLAGATFKRWFWLGLQAGTVFGVSFVHWLMYQSIFNIGSLCLYCMLVWAVTIPIFWYTLLMNITSGHITVPSRLRGAADFALRHHFDALIVWYLLIAGVILKHFWYYFGG